MRSATRAFIPLLFIGFSFVACSRGDSDSPGSSSISVKVDAPEQVSSRELVDLRLTVRNESRGHIELGGGFPDDRYSIRITDKDGNLVWLSETDPVEDILITWTMAPRQTVEYEATWRVTDTAGQALPPGDYFVSGEVRLVGRHVTSPTKRIRVVS